LVGCYALRASVSIIARSEGVLKKIRSRHAIGRVWIENAGSNDFSQVRHKRGMFHKND